MKALIAMLLLAIAGAAYAACRTHTIIGPNGQMIICTTCCDSRGNCNSFCN